MRTLTITLTTVSCALLCLAAIPAFAAELKFTRPQDAAATTTEAPTGDKGVAAGYGIGGDWFKTVDADNNGVIDKDEHIMFLGKHFDDADQNGDGWVDERERQSAAWSWATDESGQAFLDDWFENPTDRISRQDHNDAGMTIFGQWDANNDEKVTGDEFKTSFRTK